MTHVPIRSLFICFVCSAGIAFTSCKSKGAKTDSETTTETTAPMAPMPDTVSAAPVTVSTDDALNMGVKTATKDYPGVKTEINNGEITLTGNIQRSQLPNLMMALNSLKPKKINNNLTIK